MSYNPYPYHYQGFQPPPIRPMAPAASTSYQQPYSRPGNSAGSNRQNNYDMTWQHDMDEFERFLKDDKKTRKRSRSRSRSWDRNSGSFRSRSVGSDRSLRGSPRRKKGYQSPSPRHRNEHWSQSPRHKPEHQSPSPDRLSDISTDSFYDTERLLRESNRLLQKGAETHGSVSPERKHERGSIERDQYQRRSFDRGRSPVRGRPPEGGRYERSSLNRARTPERGQYGRISSPEAGRYQRSSLDRGRSPDRLPRNSPDRRRSPDRLRRNSPDRRQSPDRLRRNSPDRRQSPDRLRRNSPDRRRSPDLLRRNSPYGRRSPDRLQRNSPDRRQSLDRQSYRQNLPDRGQFSRNSPVRGRSHDIERKDRDVRSRGSLDTYPPKRSPSPLLDTLRELDRLEMELNISSRSRLKSANLRRGVSGAMLREDRSPERELPRVDPHNKLVQPNKTNTTTRTKPRKTRWGKELPKNNANLNIGNSNNKTQGKNNANQRGGNKNNNKNKGRNQNNVNQGKNNANQKSGNNNKNQGKKNNNANMQSGKNNLKQQSGKNNQRQQSGKDNIAKGSSARSTSDERHTGNKKDDKKKDEKKSDTSRSRSRNRSADDKNRSSRRSDTSDKQRSNSPHGAKRKRSVSKDRSKDRKSGESKTSKQSESSSSKKLKVDDTGHKKTDKKSENDGKNKNSKNDKDSTKKEKGKGGDKDHEKKSEDKKMVEKKKEETKDKDQKSDNKNLTPEKDKTKTDGEKQEVKGEEKVKTKPVEKKENEKDENGNKTENKTSSSETKQSIDSKKHEKSENSGNKTEKCETTSAVADGKNEDVKKQDAKNTVVEKKGSEEQSSGKNEKSDKETAPVVEQSKASPSKSESEKSTNAGETKVVEKEKESDSATKKGSLVGYKIPKLPKPPTPEKTSPRLSRESSRVSEEFEDSDSDSDPSPYKSRWRSHSPPSSKTVHVHIVEGRTRNQILASSNSVVTTIKDSDPGAAERETRELLMKLLMKSQETQEEQGEDNENVEEKVSDDTTKKGKESEVTENETKPVVQEEPAKSNVTVAETDEKSDRLAQLLKMSKEIEEEIMKLTGAGTSSDAPKEKSESETKATEKKDKEKDSDGNKKVDNKMDEQGKKNDGNQTKQKEDENESDQKSLEKEDISAEDLDKVDLSSIQTKTLLSRLLKQSKMLEHQLELLSSGGTSKSEVKDDKNEIPAAKTATVSKENEKASVDFTKVASVSSSEKGKKLESPTKSSAVTSNSSASKTSVSKTVASKTPVVSYSNSLQSLKKSTSSLVSKGSQSSTPAVQVSAITSIESAPVEQVQTTQTKQPPTSKQNTPATQAPVKQSVPPSKQSTGQQNTKSNPSQNKQMAKQVPQNKQNTNKQAQKHSHLTGVLPIGLGAQTVPQSKPNVTRHPVIQPVRPNIAASRPVNPVTSAGVFNRPMVSQQIPPPTYFPPRPMVPGPSLTPLMSLPVAPIPQAMTGLFLSAPSSNPVSVLVPISTMSMSNPPMIASQNTSYQPMVSGPNSNQTMMSGPNSNRAMMSGPNSNQAMMSGPNSNRAMMSGPNSSQTIMSGPNSNQTMMGGPNSSQTLISGPNSNQPMMSGSRSMEMDSGSKFETVALNQRHQSGRNLQNIVSIPQANFTRQAKSQNSKYTRVTNSRPNLTNSGMNKDLSKGRNVFPEPGDQLESSLLSNVKDTEQQLYIRSLWGDGGIGPSDSAGPSSFSSNVSIMSSSDIGFGDEKMTAGSSCGEGFGGGPLDPGRFKLRCMNCGDIGHETRDCQEPKPPYTDVQCRRCKQHGHKGRDCPLDVKNKKKLATKKPCYECGEKGHLAKDCPWTRCFNCGGLGHKARDCNSANIGEELEDIWCQFCGQDGHFDSSCPRKNRESEQVTEEMVARTYKENEIKRLRMYLLNVNNKRKMKNAPLDILLDACKYLNLGLRFKFETSVVTRVDNIELLSAALKMSGDVFLARVFGYNRQILKARLYEKALEVLLSEPESLIVEEQDPGAHGYRITKDIYDDVCEKAAQDKECQKFLIRVATQPDTKDEFFIQKIEELRQENKISQYTVIAALRERHKLIYEKMNKATLAEILSNPDVDSNATDLFQIGKNPHEPWKVLDKFVIMEKEEMCNIRKSSAFDILFYSAERNGMLLQWWNRCIYTKAPNIYKCNIWLQNQSIGEAYTINKEEAKKLAAADALSNLYKRVPAVRIATAGNHKTKLWVTYREVYEKAEALRMASINVNSPFERWIIQVCNEIIMDYLKRPTLESLEFKPGFSEIEIAEIRTLSSSKGLNYQLRKDATGMTVVIDKELHPMEMLAILRQSGGLNGMYSVVSAFECENISKQMEIGNLLTVRDIDD